MCKAEVLWQLFYHIQHAWISSVICQLSRPSVSPLVSIFLSSVMGCDTKNPVKVTTHKFQDHVPTLPQDPRRNPHTYWHLNILTHSQLWHVSLCPSSTVCSSLCPLSLTKINQVSSSLCLLQHTAPFWSTTAPPLSKHICNCSFVFFPDSCPSFRERVSLWGF